MRVRMYCLYPRHTHPPVRARARSIRSQVRSHYRSESAHASTCRPPVGERSRVRVINGFYRARMSRTRAIRAYVCCRACIHIRTGAG